MATGPCRSVPVDCLWPFLAKEDVLALDPGVEVVLARAIDEAARESRDDILRVSPSVRSFLLDLSRESLLFREGEWNAQNLNPSDPLVVYETVREASRSVISEADDTIRRRGNPAPLTAVVESVHERWCGIWPLCR